MNPVDRYLIRLKDKFTLKNAIKTFLSISMKSIKLLVQCIIGLSVIFPSTQPKKLVPLWFMIPVSVSGLPRNPRKTLNTNMINNSNSWRYLILAFPPRRELFVQSIVDVYYQQLDVKGSHRTNRPCIFMMMGLLDPSRTSGLPVRSFLCELMKGWRLCLLIRPTWKHSCFFSPVVASRWQSGRTFAPSPCSARPLARNRK